MATTRPLAIVTGASSGIGLELARLAARDGYDLLIAADRDLEPAAAQLRAEGATVETIETDLARSDGVDELVAAAEGRRVDLLFANAGHGLGGAFLDQDWTQARHVVDTNVTGTLRLVHAVARGMRGQGAGRILFTGSIAGYMPGSYQAVYNGSKSFIDNFAQALRDELKDSGVTVTLLMPGVTATEFFDRAGLQDTEVGQGSKDGAVTVAKTGYDAMMAGRDQVVTGARNKIMTSLASITPAALLAKRHRSMAEPGYSERQQQRSGLAMPLLVGAGALGLALLAGSTLRRRDGDQDDARGSRSRRHF